MSVKCLVTYLEGIADNSSLVKINEGRLKFKRSQYADGITGINIRVYSAVQTLVIIGNGSFTDVSGNVIGKTINVTASDSVIAYVDSDVREISIPNKHMFHWIGNATGLYTFVAGSPTNSQSAIVPDQDIRDFKWFTDLRRISVANSGLTGDLSDLSQIKNLTYLDIRNCPITGDLSDLTDKTMLQLLNISGTSIAGDVASLPNSLTGDFSFRICHNIYGDLGLVPKNIRFMSNTSGNSTFTYTSNIKNRTDILFLQNITITSGADQFLIDMSGLNFNPINTTSLFYSRIDIKANITSASSAAIEALQDKGVTIIITPL